jgi:glycosyltransferase involved in cell wall biosynthesis
MPSVSVIVPNYNHAPYLPVRLRSILEQTYSDFELLILDDCSPDNSREIIESFAADPRVRVAFNEKNSGNTYLQWRKGLDLTGGEYIWVAESDDFSDTRFLERLLPLLQTNPEAGLAFCETLVVDEEGKELGWYGERSLGAYPRELRDLLNREFVKNGRDYVRSMMFPWNSIPNASAVLFRRAALEAAGGPVTSMRICGDWLLYCKILSKWEVGHIPERFNHFRQHAVNVRSNVRRAALAREWLNVSDWIGDEIGDLPRTARREADRYIAEVLLGIDRNQTRNRVPLSRMAGALARAARLSPRLLLPTADSLARQLVGSIANLLRLRRRSV